MATDRVRDKAAVAAKKEKPQNISDWEGEGGAVVTREAWENYKQSAEEELETKSSLIEDLKKDFSNVNRDVQETTLDLFKHADSAVTAARNQLVELTAASKPAFVEMKQGMDRALGELRTAWQRAKEAYEDNSKQD